MSLVWRGLGARAQVLRIAALEGDVAAATAGYRAAIAAWKDMGLPWDEALTELSAATRLGTGTPGVADWVARARTIFTDLGAAPMLDLLDRATATESVGHGAADAVSSAEGSAGVAAEESLVS